MSPDKQQIFDLVKQYYAKEKASKKDFEPGDRITYAGRVFDEEEMVNLVDTALDFWLTCGPYTDKFERELAHYLGVKFCSLVNSGSSANLVAFMSLTSHKLGERKINQGDEVITVAAGFPATVSPIIQFGAIPVFVDVTIPEYNIDVSQLEAARSDRTKAVMIAHTLGNPFNLKAVKSFCDQHGLWLIEDNCDALGSTYTLDGEKRLTGAIGDIGTSSFYPPHHMTMGEGGAVYTNNARLSRIIDSFRDWGRDCFCPSGKDNTCQKRFSQQFGDLPFGYDHKYVYSHFGYNLKATDMQAAIGVAQLKKLPGFVEARRNNWKHLRTRLNALSDYFVLPEPELNSDPSWFGFMMTIKEDAGFSRKDIVSFLEKENIQTRNLFAGNLLKHPCFDTMRQKNEGFRVVGPLTETDRIMEHTFWVGVYPGLSQDMLDYMADKLIAFCEK